MDEARTYWSEHRAEIVGDIAALVEQKSDEDAAGALQVALEIAGRLGFVGTNEGMIGYADWRASGADGGAGCGADMPATDDMGVADADSANNMRPQYAMICHVDTVPEGPGWSFPAFKLNEHDGYLVGRGVSDDKGPLVIALHALCAVRQRLEAEGRNPNCDWRFLFGTCEETTMDDVKYYLAYHDQPDFLFTPDAEWPVSYGEKGIMHAHILSAPIATRTIERVDAGTVMNAVPGTAALEYVLRTPAREYRDTLQFTGKTAHASRPEGGVNAIGLLAHDFLENDMGSADERTFFKLIERVVETNDGSGLGIACADEEFGALTCVGSTLHLIAGPATLRSAAQAAPVSPAQPDEQVCLELGIDVRFPTSITAAELQERINAAIAPYGATLVIENLKEPFLIDKDGPFVQTLSAAYQDVTGRADAPFTMAGGTYARCFKNAVSFGAEFPWETENDPAWVGGMHAANEAVREDLLKLSFEIYCETIYRLSIL